MYIIYYPLSIIDHPLSIIDHPLSIVDHPLSIIDHPLSIIDHPLSIIHYPSSIEALFGNHLGDSLVVSTVTGESALFQHLVLGNDIRQGESNSIFMATIYTILIPSSASYITCFFWCMQYHNFQENWSMRSPLINL